MPNHCPKCRSEHGYPDGEMWVCPECFHEWRAGESEAVAAEAETAELPGVRDSNGNELATGDSVIVIKDLKVKGAAATVKSGTKVRNIRVLDGEHIFDGH